MHKQWSNGKSPAKCLTTHLAEHCFIISFIFSNVHKKPVGAALNIDKLWMPGWVPILLETSLTDEHALSCTSAFLHRHTCTHITHTHTKLSHLSQWCVCVQEERRRGRNLSDAAICFSCVFPLSSSSHSLLPLYIFSHLISWTGNKFHVLCTAQ